MKNKDLTKHLKEEKRALKRPAKIFTFLLLLVLTELNPFAQVYINGFVKYDELETLNNSELLYSSFLDGDSKNDFITLTDTTFLGMMLSEENYRVKRITTPVIISRIEKLTYGEYFNRYFYLSRKTKSAGIIEISNTGYYRKISSVKFKSYPCEFSLYKKGNKVFALIYGPSFDGIEMAVIDGDTLQTVNIVENTLVPAAEFIDIDYDGYIDIIYYDYLRNTLKFLLNTHDGGFWEGREIKFSSTLKSFKPVDYNFDGYFDLIYLYENGIAVDYGDSVSTFLKEEKIIDENNISEFLLNDFNRDGYYDIVTRSDSSVKVYFSKLGFNLSKPVDYSTGESIIDIDNLHIKYSSFSVLTKGTLKLFSPLSGSSEIDKMIIGSSPYNIFKYEDKAGRTKGFFVFDSIETVINFLDDSFTKLYTVPASLYFNNLKTVKTSNDEMFIYLFNAGDKLIEVTKLNLNDGSYRKSYLYSEIPVTDIALTVNENNPPAIIVNGIKAHVLLTEEIHFRDFRYQFAKPLELMENVITAAAGNENVVYYLSADTDGKLYIGSIPGKEKTAEPVKQINQKYNPEFTYEIDVYKNRRNEDVVSVRAGGSFFIYYNEEIRPVTVKFLPGETIGVKFDSNRENDTFVYLSRPDKNELYEIGPVERLKKTIDVGKYLVNAGEHYIVDYIKKDLKLIYSVIPGTNKIEVNKLK